MIITIIEAAAQRRMNRRAVPEVIAGVKRRRDSTGWSVLPNAKLVGSASGTVRSLWCL
ncbi:hypothetical protein ACFYRG_38470 [Streptomyces mirabilis]|uniref:hypothetical protein n=1 Tax=Streptomyces mirabilis TaxID=68239 RepID=UPI0036889923